MDTQTTVSTIAEPLGNMGAAETVLAVLTASRDGASINAAAKAAGINYRTAQRIVEAAQHQQRQLAVVG